MAGLTPVAVGMTDASAIYRPSVSHTLPPSFTTLVLFRLPIGHDPICKYRKARDRRETLISSDQVSISASLRLNIEVGCVLSQYRNWWRHGRGSDQGGSEINFGEMIIDLMGWAKDTLARADSNMLHFLDPFIKILWVTRYLLHFKRVNILLRRLDPSRPSSLQDFTSLHHTRQQALLIMLTDFIV